MCDLPGRPDRSLKLFEVDGAWRQCGGIYNGEDTACGDAWDAYACSYREAVQCLVKAVEKGGEFTYATFGYPTFFLVHQYLELRMKEIIKNGRPLVEDNGGLQNGHNLVDLWGECKEVLKKLEGWGEYKELEAEALQTYLTMDHFIREMNQDLHGQSFRYPVDRNGTPLLNNASIHTLNVKNLGIVFEWVSSTLEGVSNGIDDERKDKKRKVLAESQTGGRPDCSLKLFEVDGAGRQCGGVYNGEDTGCGDAWDAYALGYLEAVLYLVKAVERKEFKYTTSGYPIFFLVHQYLELRMKEIIKNGRPFIVKKGGLQKGHDLVQLWGECKKVLKELEGWDEYNELDNEARQTYLTMDHFIREMNQDPRGQSFRYPVDQNGTPLLNNDTICTLNVKNLGIVFEWISNMLDGISTGIDEERKARAKYEAEFRGEYSR